MISIGLPSGVTVTLEVESEHEDALVSTIVAPPSKTKPSPWRAIRDGRFQTEAYVNLDNGLVLTYKGGTPT